MTGRGGSYSLRSFLRSSLLPAPTGQVARRNIDTNIYMMLVVARQNQTVFSIIFTLSVAWFRAAEVLGPKLLFFCIAARFSAMSIK